MTALSDLLKYTDAIVDEWAFTSQEQAYQELKAAAVEEAADLRTKLDEAIAWHEGDASPRAELERKAAAWDALTVTLKDYHPVLEQSAVTGKWHITLPDFYHTDAGDDPAELVAEAVEKMKGE